MVVTHEIFIFRKTADVKSFIFDPIANHSFFAGAKSAKYARNNKLVTTTTRIALNGKINNVVAAVILFLSFEIVGVALVV